MFKWEKLGKIFDPRDVKNKTWISEFAQAPSTIVFNDFVRVYFSCRPLPDNRSQYVSYSAYVDLNRKNLFEIINIAKQPVLELGERGSFDEFGIYPMSVIKKDNDVIAYYGGWTRCDSVPFNVAIGMAKSSNNGESFIKAGKGPILSYTIDEPFILSSPKIRYFNDQWYLFYIAGKKWITHQNKVDPVYKIRMAVSEDGINWEKQNKDIIGNKLEHDEAQASPDVFYFNNMYHMFFCYRYSSNFRNRERGYRIGYAYSDDLINWNRNDENANIEVSNEGWDSEMISYPHLLELDGKVYMFYLGNSVGKYGFGLAQSSYVI